MFLIILSIIVGIIVLSGSFICLLDEIKEYNDTMNFLSYGNKLVHTRKGYIKYL